MIATNFRNLSWLIKFPLWLLLLSMAFASEIQEPVPFQISVNVNLVLLQATVRDRNGESVPELKAEDFAIFEDGVRQELRVFRHEDSPVTVGLVVDHSGSMRRRLDDVATAARTFVQLSSQSDEMFVVNFNEKASLGLPAHIKMSNRADDLSRAISDAPADGMTALYDAVLKGLDTLRQGSREKKVLVVVSDGGDNASVKKLPELMYSVERSAALIYTLGIFDDSDPDRNPEVLRRLARSTGGDAFFPKQPAEIVAVCERIAREIRHQYTLAYVSKNERKPGTYRSIRVTAATAEKQRLIVRTRAGYISAGIPLVEKVSANR